jgi:DNA primase
VSAPRHFPPGFVGEVRRVTRQRLVPLIAPRVNLKKAGRDWKGCCPFHAEKTPSFHVSSDGHYHCFGCRAHGDAIEWLVRGEGLTFNDAVLQLAGDADIKAPGTRRQETPAERAVREARVAHEQAEQQRIRDAEIAAELEPRFQ